MIIIIIIILTHTNTLTQHADLHACQVNFCLNNSVSQKHPASHTQPHTHTSKRSCVRGVDGGDSHCTRLVFCNCWMFFTSVCFDLN